MEERREGYVVQCDINHTDSNGFYLLPQEVSSHEDSLGFICFTPHSGAQNYGDECHIQSIDRLGKLISSRSLQKQCPSLSGYSKDLTVDCFHKD